ncbi:hypothetical protein [Fimbriiglobus ruber]|uniref:Uncharacterized protein n=1 Tax=Fimbriiglobus ruber TaxID=1908690 RepID=A0A225EB89_9BACT|nr:hypothetical protein [Fimbriiglobus ruber]OWK47296.1 hypothetical protein FRUB_00995 [Fimbriiglobus ruber]
MTDPESPAPNGRRPDEPAARASSARSTFLAALPGDDFVPPADRVAGTAALEGSQVPVHPDAEAIQLARFRRDVDAFAAAYWSLAPDARRARWAALSARAPDGRAAHRLKHLKSGLDVQITPHTDPTVEELAQVVRELYVLDTRPRAARRAEWLASHVFGPKQAAARRLQQIDPDTAALDPNLYEQLTQSTWESRSIPAMSGPEVARVEAQKRADERTRLEREEARERRNQRSQQDSLESVGKVLGWVIAVAIMVGVRAGLTHKSKSPSSDTPTPSYNVKQFPTLSPNSPLNHPFPPANKASYTDEQIEEFKQYDPNGDDPAPPGYFNWRLYNGAPLTATEYLKLKQGSRTKSLPSTPSSSK